MQLSTGDDYNFKTHHHRNHQVHCRSYLKGEGTCNGMISFTWEAMSEHAGFEPNTTHGYDTNQNIEPVYR